MSTTVITLISSAVACLAGVIAAKGIGSRFARAITNDRFIDHLCKEVAELRGEVVRLRNEMHEKVTRLREEIAVLKAGQVRDAAEIQRLRDWRHDQAGPETVVLSELEQIKDLLRGRSVVTMPVEEPLPANPFALSRNVPG